MRQFESSRRGPGGAGGGGGGGGVGGAAGAFGGGRRRGQGRANPFDEWASRFEPGVGGGRDDGAGIGGLASDPRFQMPTGRPTHGAGVRAGGDGYDDDLDDIDS